MTDVAAVGAATVPHAEGAAELRRENAAVRTTLAAGGAITSVQLDDVEWCARGRWTDHIPTLGGCTMPTFVAGVAGQVLPEGGVLAAVPPRVSVAADGTRESVVS